MRTKEQIERLKTIPIEQYLSNKGIQPVKTSGSQLVYYSPKNEESSPSFFVHPQKNVFHDFSGIGEKGDIIRLIQYLNDCNFNQAIQTLEAVTPNETLAFFLSGQKPSITKQSTTEIVRVQPLQNRALLAYVASRRISEAIATTYLEEVHYQFEKKPYYAVGFKNDKGGYELRNERYKRCTSPKWFKLITSPSTSAINLFEGVFDFLSCCERFGVVKLKNPTIVLNSLSFLTGALPIIKKYPVVNAFFDNDAAGKRGLERLNKEGVNVRDCSHYYPNSRDFNEYLVQSHIR